jgi:hypothetical protein
MEHTLASNSDQVIAHQANGRVEDLPIIPWSGLSVEYDLKPSQSGMTVHSGDRRLSGTAKFRSVKYPNLTGSSGLQVPPVDGC